MKKILILACTLLAFTTPVFADFKEHYDLGSQYYKSYQYSSAITEFKNALRINYLDNSARANLANSYMARAANYANKEKDYKKAANDFRSALFYMLYYPNEQQARNAAYNISQATDNLNKCLNMIDFNDDAENRYKAAKQLRAEGEFAAAAYEFNHAIADKSRVKDSFQQVGDIMKILGHYRSRQIGRAS